MNVDEAVRSAVAWHPAVREVSLVGSRSRTAVTPLSDWDFRLETDDPETLIRDLPTLSESLEPLGSLWDPLCERAVYMLVLPGPIKVDLFPGEERRGLEPPWEPNAGNLIAIDAHMWDWALWMGSKVLGMKVERVSRELARMGRHFQAVLGGPEAPADLASAVTAYLEGRCTLEKTWDVSIPRILGDEVMAALAAHDLVTRQTE